MNILRLSTLSPALAIAVFALAFANPLSAQEDSGQSGVLEEIIVTATKTERALQDVPIAIQVYTGDTLDKLSAADFEDFARYSPGLSFTKVRTGQSHIVMRGLSTGNVTNSQPQNRALVGIYLDDAPIQMTGFNYAPDLFDVERVEVLKGPQGTVFGDSAMAGAIRYVTAKPDLNAVEGAIQVSGSSTKDGGPSYDIKGMFNWPISETFALRGSAFYIDESGWIDNLRLNEEDINFEEIFGGRLSALYVPNDVLSVQLTVSTKRVDFGGQPATDEGRPPYNILPTDTPNYVVLGPATAPDLLPLEQDREREEAEEEANLANLTVIANTSLGTLTSVTGYIDRDYDFYTSGFDYYMWAVFGEFLQGSRLYYPWKQEYVTEEIRFDGSRGDRIEYTVGAFFARQKANYVTYGDATQYGDGPGWDQWMVDQGVVSSVQEGQDVFGCEPDESIFCGFLNTTQYQRSLFADATIGISEKLDLQLGVRWSDWKQYFHEDYAGYFNGGPTLKQVTINEDTVNPRFNLSYSFSDNTNLFVNAGKGFRFGGVNGPLPPVCQEETDELAARGVTNSDLFESDSLWTYEAGLKSRLNEGRVQLNASVFSTDWDGIQTTRNLNCGWRIIQNAGRVISQGAEFDATFQVSDGLSITVAGSYTDATMKEDSGNLDASVGDRPPYIPTWNASAFVFYDFDAANGWNGFVNAGIGAYGESYTTFSETASNRIEIPGATIANLVVGVERDNWRITAFVNNLTDATIIYGSSKYGEYGSNPYTGPRISRMIGRPRTVGVEMAYRWN